jgi:hypothetical protein
VDAFWAAAADAVPLSAPLTPDERDALTAQLPGPVARFLIRRADEALQPDDDSGGLGAGGGAGSGADMARKTRSRLSARAREWLGPQVLGPDREDDDFYSEYVFETVDQDADRVSYWRQSGDGEGEDGMEGYEPGPTAAVPTKTVSIFTGSPHDQSEQAQQVGYALLGLGLLIVAFKIILAFVQFFVSFTFSFFAIFALSAGIFVFFFILRF